MEFYREPIPFVSIILYPVLLTVLYNYHFHQIEGIFMGRCKVHFKHHVLDALECMFLWIACIVISRQRSNDRQARLGLCLYKL